MERFRIVLVHLGEQQELDECESPVNDCRADDPNPLFSDQTLSHEAHAALIGWRGAELRFTNYGDAEQFRDELLQERRWKDKTLVIEPAA